MCYCHSTYSCDTVCNENGVDYCQTVMSLISCSSLEFVNDTVCDPGNNNELCLYDGGDCCLGESQDCSSDCFSLLDTINPDCKCHLDDLSNNCKRKKAYPNQEEAKVFFYQNAFSFTHFVRRNVPIWVHGRQLLWWTEQQGIVQLWWLRLLFFKFILVHILYNRTWLLMSPPWIPTLSRIYPRYFIFNDKIHHLTRHWLFSPATCSMPSVYKDFDCDWENNIASCLFDGGDCCLTQLFGNGYCDPSNNNVFCNYDFGDCCSILTINDGVCDIDNNNEFCSYDGDDCCLENLTFFGQEEFCMYFPLDCQCKQEIKE